MSRIIFFLVLLVFSQLANSLANDFKPLSDVNLFASKMKNASDNVTSLQSDFTQIKYMEYLQASLKSQGKFWYEATEKVRWQYDQPFKYVVIINQGKLKIINDFNTNQMDVGGNALFKEINNLILGSVTGQIYNDTDYELLVLENENQYKMIVSPKDEEISKLIKSMELFFDKETLMVSSIKMVEASDDYSIINFLNTKMNETIPQNLFIH